MEQKLNRPLAPELFQTTMDRRQFVGRGIKAGATLLGAGALLGVLKKNEKYLHPVTPIDYEKYHEGFKLLSPDSHLYALLTQEPTAQSWPYETIINPDQDPRVIREIMFRTNESHFLELHLVHNQEDKTELKAASVQLDDLNLSLPIVQSSIRDTDNSIFLPVPSQGSHKLIIANRNGSPTIDESDIAHFSLQAPQGNKLQEALKASKPMYAVRPDTLDHPLRDEPCFAWTTYFADNEENLIVWNTICFNSEIGGYSDKQRLERYGKLPDMQLVVEQKVFDPLTNPTVTDTIIQAANCSWAKGFRCDPHVWIAFMGEHLGNHPLVQIKDLNNTTSNELQNRFFYAPLAQPSAATPMEILRDNPEISITSLDQSKKRGTLPQSVVKSLNQQFNTQLKSVANQPHKSPFPSI